jgi:hypothetical protein
MHYLFLMGGPDAARACWINSKAFKTFKPKRIVPVPSLNRAALDAAATAASSDVVSSTMPSQRVSFASVVASTNPKPLSLQSAISNKSLSGPPVPAADYYAALQRRADNQSTADDEVILSHSVSRGVK